MESAARVKRGSLKTYTRHVRMDRPGADGPEPPAGPHLTGQIFLARLEYLKDKHGAAAIDQVLSGLPAGIGEKLRGIDRERWYPFSALIHLDTAIAGLETEGQADIFERL